MVWWSHGEVDKVAWQIVCVKRANKEDNGIRVNREGNEEDNQSTSR